jgi:hypothetical protein
MRAWNLLGAAALCFASLSVPTSAHAAARVTVGNEFGKAQADVRYATELTLSGHGFQAIDHGYGGIYVFFGTVKGRWRPSQGGVTGEDYLYVPDAESKENQGFQKFIAFEGSDTESAAHGVLKADGSWSTTIKVPGATFEAVDRDGKVASVDCREVKCGIITIGAHGVKNARNESFTPISFANLYDAAPDPGSGPTGEPSTAPTQGSSQGSAGTGARPVPGADGATGKGADRAIGSGPATAVVDPDTAVLGRVLTLSGVGFTPGEQVTVSFDHGKAAIGPLSAGPSGEVGGVLELPADTRPGTHMLRLTGAASGEQADINFPIKSDEASVASSSQEQSSGGPPSWAAWVFLTAAFVLLVLAVLVAARRFRALRARHSHHTRAPAPGSEQEPAHAS